MTDPIRRALDVARSLWGLVQLIHEAIADGHPERVDAIIPPQLRTTIAKALADAEAERRLARMREMVEAGGQGSGQP